MVRPCVVCSRRVQNVTMCPDNLVSIYSHSLIYVICGTCSRICLKNIEAVLFGICFMCCCCCCRDDTVGVGGEQEGGGRLWFLQLTFSRSFLH